MNVVNIGSTVSPPRGLPICRPICVYRAFILAHEKLSSQSDRQRTAEPPKGKIPTIPLSRREREKKRTGGSERERDNLKKKRV